jgi:hypothetical protein
MEWGEASHQLHLEIAFRSLVSKSFMERHMGRHALHHGESTASYSPDSMSTDPTQLRIWPRSLRGSRACCAATAVMLVKVRGLS